MSFHLGVWHEPAPIRYDEAYRKYALLCDGVDAGLAGLEAVTAFHAELTARFPPLETFSDDEVDNGVWSVSPKVNHSAVVLCISWSRVDTVVPVVRTLAERHGLICCDPQLGGVHLPSMLTAGRPVLNGDQLATVPEPTREEVATIVRRLGTRHAYLCLESAPQHYLQAADGSATRLPRGHYAIEYRDGSEDAHFRRETHSLDDVVDTFDAYARGDQAWRDHQDWRRWP